MATILVLGAGLNQMSLIEAGLEDGLTVVAIDPDENAPGMFAASFSYNADLSDFDRCLEIAKKHRVDGVVTLAADFPMPLLAHICRELRLPGPDPEAVECSTDKARMRHAFCRFGIGPQNFREISTPAQAIAAVAEFEVPVVIKPTVSSGGRGICRLDRDSTAMEIEDAFAEASFHSRNNCAIVETLVSGPEYSVESITVVGSTNVVAITQKTTSDAPYFVEIAHHQPATLCEADKDRLKEAAICAASACGIDNAPSHAEIRLTRTGPVVMEIAARMGGGYISSHLTPISTGVDLVRAAIDVALGNRPDIRSTVSRGSAVRFLCPAPGRVVSVSDLSEVQKDPSCVQAVVYRKPGDIIPPLRNATGRAGHVIARGNTGEEAARNAERLAGRVVIETEPYSS